MLSEVEHGIKLSKQPISDLVFRNMYAFGSTEHPRPAHDQHLRAQQVTNDERFFLRLSLKFLL